MHSTPDSVSIVKVHEGATLADLQRVPHWVVFAQVPRPDGGKPRKLPFTPGTNREARVNDPSTWRPHAEAVADAERTGRHPGIALTPAMNITLVDIDGVAVHELVDAINSYTELSINHGLHVLAGGRPPDGFIVPAGVEVYPRAGNRFCLLTGDIVGGRDRIIDRSDVLARVFPARPEPARFSISWNEPTIDDHEVIRRTLCMAKGRQLHRDGDMSGHPSGSEADLALLCAYVSAGVTDPDRLDALYRGSALYPKRQSRWDDSQYRGRTLARALDGHVQPFEGWERVKTGAVPGKPQDAATVDPCPAERDAIAQLRAENATLKRQLAERDAAIAALSQLQAATMAALRAPDARPSEKIIGLIALFEGEAAHQRGIPDTDGWFDTPLERLAESGGCSADTAGKNLTRIASTGAIETRTATRRNPTTGEMGRHRQIRFPPRADGERAPTLPERILALSVSPIARPPEDKGWGGRRVCPDCGDVGTITTVACAGCGQVLSRTAQPPRATRRSATPNPQDAATVQHDARESTEAPFLHLAPTKVRGLTSPLPQDAATVQRSGFSPTPDEPTWLADAPDSAPSDHPDVWPTSDPIVTHLDGLSPPPRPGGILDHARTPRPRPSRAGAAPTGTVGDDCWTWG